ncbi:MAG: hypothetical protein HQK51_09110 [Oligoflexia bacterium]|nr:hypothetical protein [Oligoflexia bacterium]
MEIKMEENLLIVERVVLESLTRKTKNIAELVVDTGLSILLLKKILSKFLEIGAIVKNKSNVYELNDKKIAKLFKYYNSISSRKEEVKELLNIFVDSALMEKEKNHENQQFPQTHSQRTIFSDIKMKKLWMTPEENFYYQSLINKLELFLKEISDKQDNRAHQNRLAEQNVIFWGNSHYANLMNTFLQNI